MTVPRRLKRFSYLVIAFVVFAGLAGWLVPMPATEPTFMAPKAAGPAAIPNLSWPPAGQAALGAKGYGILETHGDQTPAPTASVAKVFTALAILAQKPLTADRQGPVITITQTDLDSYETYFTQGGSLVPVALGEQISERQALEALLLPSANNMADTLARWAFGSVDNYISYINQFNAQLGLTQTHIADASGFSPSTVSSAQDLVKIGQLAVANPVLASIVSEQEATIPVAGVIHNTNWLLGDNGINGIKTGNTDAAGGCFLFSSQQQIAAKKITVIGAVMSAPTLQDALNYSHSLAVSAGSGFVQKEALKKGQPVGRYELPWGKIVPITASADVNILSWYQKSPALNYSASAIHSIRKGQRVGTYSLSSGIDNVSINLLAGTDSGHAPWTWRLFQRYL
jgi:D-alanyl-D-alanine carboxypeptidase (penicillin-binding protein 5/6)